MTYRIKEIESEGTRYYVIQRRRFLTWKTRGSTGHYGEWIPFYFTYIDKARRRLKAEQGNKRKYKFIRYHS